MIKIEHLSKHYQELNHIVKALDDIELELPYHGMVFVTGKSGSGKTTLLYLLGGLIEPTSGIIKRFDGLHRTEDVRLHTGFVFQNYNLFNDLTVAENLYTSSIIKNQQISHDDIDKILNQFDLNDFQHKKVSNLSGGEQQRIAIARAILHKPQVILADEPTGNLDEENAKIVNTTLKEISKTRLVVYVTHDLNTANTYGDIIIDLSSGQIKNIVVKEEQRPLSIEDDIKVHKSNIKIMGFITKFAHKFLLHKPARFMLTIASFVIASLLLLMVLSLSHYQENKVIADYIETYDINDYVLYSQHVYLDIFGQTMTEKSYHGPYLMDMIEETYEDIKSSKIKLNQYSPNLLVSPNIIYTDMHEPFIDLTFIEGELPNITTEIVISDYLASSNQLSVNDTIDINTYTLTISGIFQTDYIESNYIIKKVYGSLTVIDQHQEKYQYLSIYLSEDILDDMKQVDALSIPHQKMMRNPSLQISLSASTLLSKIKNDTELIYGRLPVNSNEVLISLDYAYDLELLNEGLFEETTFSFYNYQDDRFNDAYDDYMNLYTYFNTGIHIVGIVNNTDQTIYIDESTFDSIIDQYYTHYYQDEIIWTSTYVWQEEQLNLLEEGMRFNEPMINMIYSFSSMLVTINPVLIVLLVVFTLLALFMITTLLLNAFYQGMKDIAIMQSLGLSKKRLIFIFITQFMEIIIISTISLAALYTITILGINSYYNATVNLKDINIYLFDIKAFVITCLSMIGVGGLVDLMLLNKVIHTNTISMIKSN
jgi:ABC-type lipoprotein export system ATPase subunit